MSFELKPIRSLILPTSQVNPATLGRETFRYVDIASVDRDSKAILDAREIKIDAAPSRARKSLEEGDVVISTVRPNLNAVALIPAELNGAVGSTGFSVLRSNRLKLLPSYLFYAVQRSEFIDSLTSQACGASYPAVSDDQVKAERIPVPQTLKEQAKITELLGESASILMSSRTRREELKSFAGRFYRDRFGSASTNPRLLKVRSLGSIITTPEFGISAALSNNRERVEGSYPVLRMPNITPEGWLDTSDLRYEILSDRRMERLAVQKQDLLFNWRNSPNWVGKTAIFDADGVFTFASFLFRFRALDDEADTAFLWAFLNQLRREGFFEMRCRQAVSQANFGREELAAIEVPLPPREERIRFAMIYEDYRKLWLDSVTAQVKLETLFQTLLQRAFDGRLTAKWREAHSKELLEEMHLQSRA